MNEIVNYVTNSNVGVILSEKAMQYILSYLDQQKESKGVRFSVTKTGCSGLSYVIEYVDASEETDLVFPLSNHYQIFMDKKSYPFLKGMYVDYVKQGLNFKFVFENPNQTGQCGCGESFTVE